MVADALSQILDDSDAARQREADALTKSPAVVQGGGGGSPPRSAPANVPPPVAPPSTSPQGGISGFVSNLFSNPTKAIGEAGAGLPDIATGAVAGAIRAPAIALGGLFDFGQDTGRFLGEAASPFFMDQQGPNAAGQAVLAVNKAVSSSPLGQAYRNVFDQDGTGRVSYADTLSSRSQFGKVGNSTANEVVAQTLAVASAFGAASKTATAERIGASLAAKYAPGLLGTAQEVAATSAAVGATGAVVMDPEEERLSNGLQQLGLHTAFTDWLAEDPKDNHMESRFKSAVEQTLVGAAADSVFQAAKYWKLLSAGKTAEAEAVRTEMAASINKQATDQSGGLAKAGQPADVQIVPGTVEEHAAQNVEIAHAEGATKAARDEHVASINPELQGEASQGGGAPQQPESAKGAPPSPEVKAPSPSEESAAPLPEPFTARPAARALPRDTFTRDLSRDAPGGLYRETNVDSLEHYLPGRAGQQFGGGPVNGYYFSDVPELAKGQGKNKGVLLEFDSKGIEGRPDFSKPAAQMSYESGAGEYHSTLTTQSALKKNLRAIRISKDALSDPRYRSRYTRNLQYLEQDGWIKTETANYVQYQRPPLAHEPGPLAQSANDALSAAGVSEQVDPATMHVNPDGKILVSPEAKAAADRSGYGKAFTDTPQAPTEGVTFKAVKDDTSRIVGFSSKEDLQKFGAYVSQLRDAPAEALDVSAEQSPELAAKVGDFKISRLNTAEDTPAVLRGMIEHAPIDKTVRPDADLMASASAAERQMGEDATTVLAAARQIAGNVGDVDMAVKALQAAWVNSAKQVDYHLDTNWDLATQSQVDQAIEAIHQAMTLSNYFAQTKTGIGRALRSLRLVDADTYVREFKLQDTVNGMVKDAKVPGAMSPLPRDRGELSDWLELWKAFKGDPKGRANWLEGLNTLPDALTYSRQSLANLFTTNILSGLPSVVFNLTGPAIVSALRTAERTVGAGLAAMNPMLTAVERQDLLRVAADAPQAYVQTIGDVRDAFKYATDAFTQNRSILGGGGSIRDIEHRYNVTPGMLRAAAGTDADANAYVFGNVINMWPRAFARLNNGLDEFAKRLAYNGEARAQALLSGAKQGLSGDALAEHVRDFVTNSTDEVGAATSDDLLHEAERSTLTGTPGADGTLARQGANYINKIRQTIPEARIILPIFNVSANSIGETLRRIPILNAAFAETRKELAGELGPIAQADAYGRTALAGTWMLAGLGMAQNGLITGGGPTDPAQRKVWLQGGHQPYSIRLGDQWLSYQRYDILGALLGIPALVFDKSVNARMDQDWGHRTVAGLAATAQYFRDKTALQTASDFLSFGSGDVSTAQAFLNRLGGGTFARLFVPNFATQLGRNPFEGQTVKHTAGDFAADTLPAVMRPFAHLLSMGFVSEKLDPLRNTFGEPVHRPQDTLWENTLPVTIAPVGTYAQDPESDELDRLYETTGSAMGIPAPNMGAFDARDIKLEDGTSLYDRIVSQRQHVTVGDQMLRQSMTELFASPDYADAVDAPGNVKTTSTGDISRGYLVSQVYSQYQKAAVQAAAQSSPIAARYLAVAEIKRKGDSRFHDFNAHQLADSDLLKNLGIDVTDYENKVKGQ